jgi:hypothetical protein
MHNLLDQLLGSKAILTKQRELYLVGRTRIHLDEVEGLGQFMELEVVLSETETDAEGERVALSLMEQLGVHHEDLVEQAYVDLIEAETVANAVVQSLQMAIDENESRYDPNQLSELSSVVVAAVRSALATFFENTAGDSLTEVEISPIETHQETLPPSEV